jgi:hypothetical protein
LLHEGAMTTPTETTTNDEVAVQPFLERLEVEDTLHDMDNPPETIAVVEDAVVEETSTPAEEPETETSPPSDTAVVNEEPLPSSDTTTADSSQASSDGDIAMGNHAMREVLSQQRDKVAQDEQTAMVRAAAEDAQQFMNQLTSQGYAEEDARTQAQSRFEQSRIHLSYQTQIQNVQQETQAKMLVASKFAADYGVSVDSLLTFGTPQEMEASAKGRADTRKLKEENASLKKARVPNQTMEQTSSIAESNTSRYRILDDYAEGRRTEDDPLVKKALNI